MRSLVFVWPYWLVFWAVFVWVLLPEFAIIARAKRTVKANKEKDSGSLEVILRGTSFAMMAALPLSFVRATLFPPSWLLPAFVAGTAILAASGLLRRHCFRILGEFFTGDVQTRGDQPVIDRGAYHWVRHPSYTAGIMMFTGIGLALANWLSFVILVGVSIFVYSYRVAVEEKALVRTLGEPYVRFMKTRKRFIPFII